jgi:hypothetical protein
MAKAAAKAKAQTKTKPKAKAPVSEKREYKTPEAAAKQKAAAKKPAKAAKANNGRLADDMKVKLGKDWDAANLFPKRGKNIRFERARRLKDGMTVAEFAKICKQTAVCANGGRAFLVFLRDRGHITVG